MSIFCFPYHNMAAEAKTCFFLYLIWQSFSSRLGKQLLHMKGACCSGAEICAAQGYTNLKHGHP